MNEFHQQKKLSNQQLNNRDNENNIYKDVSVPQTSQHCKSEILNPEHSSHDHSSQPFVDQLLSKSNLSNETSPNHTDKNSNKDELLTIVDRSDKSLITTKKRVTPIPASYIRRRPNLIKQPLNTKLLTPNNKSNLSNTDTIIKKSTPIFIAPKKTSPQPHSFSSLSFDDSLQIKRKPILERQTALIDDHNSPSMTTWTSAPSVSPTRFYVQSSGSSPDEDSSDESDHESLLIRKKNFKIKKQQYNSSFPTYFNIPSAIFITDPYGHSHTFDPDNELQKNNEQIFENDSNSMDTNILSPDSVFEMSSAPEIVLIPPTPSIILDKHTLDSIGEVEEEENDDNQTNRNKEKKDQHQIDKVPLDTRWSDDVFDQKTEQISSSKPNLTKIPSAASIPKQPESSPVKFSKTKYLLMKLHLKSSSKDDELNMSTPTKRTVHRSTDKKHSSLQIPTFESNTRLNESSNTLTSDDPNQRIKPGVFTSVGNLNVADDTDEDDIDGTFEKAKGLEKRSSSFKDIRGSQLSLNSAFSDAKARYGLDISGTIHLKLTYTLKTGALDVLIIKCTDLAKAKKHQTSDPYVKAYLLPDRSKNSKRKTVIKKNTINPIFEEKFRYHVTKQEFETRVLWISVWSQASMGQNDFLGEIHIPLSNCTLDEIEEFQLLAKKTKADLSPVIQPTMDPGEIQFELTFIENPKNKDLGIIQVNNIEGKAIYHGKTQVDAICKGLLMPDNLKRRLPNIRKGPTPRWEIPLRWEGIRRDNLKNTSVEVSIWSQERLRKVNIGFVRLNLAQIHFDNKPAKWLDSTTAEKSYWEAFLRKPTQIHHIKLPLRPPPIENK